ncbi:butyrophilin subfamily 3 member A1-like isoform X2 [Stegostoma tigrinum]|uniref:butyrophilin subfamily 3 member A1-like isoform X2 n=1 Tax=Stegostoma tigrinum TaxID=3053191 RepID=UPI0028701830|nr:butyrophilin subfamily 3 member A1-like isoform X2 [Stegostoma tigrinum]
MEGVHHFVLLLLVIHDSAKGEFLVVGPAQPVEATVGEDALLECHLVPDLSASNMLVQWFISGLESPVHIYRHGEDDAAAQHRNYRGRTELLKNKLTQGAISLRIKNITVFDSGEYRCLIDDGNYSEETAVKLNVIGLGHQPWIQLKGYHENGIQLVCKSSGWFSQPEIQWINEDGLALSQAELSNDIDSNGLVNVQSIIIVTKQLTNKFTCLIKNDHLGITRTTTIRISDDIFPGVPDWLAPLLTTLCCVIAGIAALLYWSVKHHRQIKELELQKSFVECVSVTLDLETVSSWLEVSKDLKSMKRTWTWRSLPDTGKRFSNWDCALGSEGFTSGRHYWEVEVLGNQRWILGVASESVQRKDWVRLIPDNRFWTIERFRENFDVNSIPQTPLCVDQVPGKVGIYLSYESGTISFYNADTKSHLHTFAGNKFTEKLYPFFQTFDVNQFLKICSTSDRDLGKG